MNYLKAAVAGLGMSFIGTALCGTTMGSYYHNGYTKDNVFHCLMNAQATLSGDKQICLTLQNLYGLGINNGKLSTKNFDSVKYYNDNRAENASSFWIPKSWKNGILEKEWSFATSQILNIAYCVPSALLGASFHSFLAQDLTKSFNDYCGTNISTYLMTGSVIGAVGSFIQSIGILCENTHVRNDLTKPWFYTLAIMRGFIVGAAAMAGAYFGDETVTTASPETATELENDLVEIIY